jgi:penicillin-binding protein 1A
MTAAHKDLPVQSSITQPKGITRVTFDKKSGLLPSSLTPVQFISSEICAVDSVPTSVSDIWVEIKVDPDNPDQIAPDDMYNAVTKLCLNISDRPKILPGQREAPYKLPGMYAPKPILTLLPPLVRRPGSRHTAISLFPPRFMTVKLLIFRFR